MKHLGMYIDTREEGPSNMVNIKKAYSVLIRCRITQLECVVFRTAKKSRHPESRLATVLSGFDTAKQADGERHEAGAELSPPVKE